jgi:hypothetical protein
MKEEFSMMWYFVGGFVGTIGLLMVLDSEFSAGSSR